MPNTNDDRTISLMRLVLALSAYLIVVLNRAKTEPLSIYMMAAVTVYVLYSAGICAVRLRQRAGGGARPFKSSFFLHWQHWVDIGYYTLLIPLSGGTNSPFFLFYFFAIIVAAFEGGFPVCLRATMASAFLLFVLGFVTLSADQESNFDRFLLRPAYLLIFGYIIATLGGSELALRRRLFLLKDMNSLSNPRFGIERTLGNLAERIRDFYDADKCVMVMNEWHQMAPHLRRALRAEPGAAMRTLPLNPGMLHQLLTLPGHRTVWRRRNGIETKNGPLLHIFNHDKGEFFVCKPTRGDENPDHHPGLESLEDTLEAEEFFSTPMCYRGVQAGRLFITGPRRRFSNSEAQFLMQAIEHVMPSLDNTLLLDRLASDAADEERQRIARDLHDSIIQPYIGLRIGLSALSNELHADTHVKNQVQRLVEMTDMGIEGLYNYVTNLKAAGRESGELGSSIERFVAKFSAASTIRVEVEMDASIQLNDRLAAEVFQMISEGLSNVRRHTGATRARIKIGVRADNLELSISNESPAPPENFVPRSIVGRAAALGGSALVEQQVESTIVRITIPL